MKIDERTPLTEAFLLQNLTKDFEIMRFNAIALTFPSLLMIGLMIAFSINTVRTFSYLPAQILLGGIFAVLAAATAVLWIAFWYGVIRFWRWMQNGTFRLTEDTLERIGREERRQGKTPFPGGGSLYNRYQRVERHNFHFVKNGCFRVTDDVCNRHGEGDTFYLLLLGENDRIAHIYSTRSYKR